MCRENDGQRVFIGINENDSLMNMASWLLIIRSLGAFKARYRPRLIRNGLSVQNPQRRSGIRPVRVQRCGCYKTVSILNGKKRLACEKWKFYNALRKQHSSNISVPFSQTLTWACFWYSSAAFMRVRLLQTTFWHTRCLWWGNQKCRVSVAERFFFQ